MQDNTFLKDAIPWCFTALSIFGTWRNSIQDKKCFYYWLIANSGFFTIFALDEMYAQSCLFGVFIVFNLVGLAKWK